MFSGKRIRTCVRVWQGGQLNCNSKNQSPRDYTAFHFSGRRSPNHFYSLEHYPPASLGDGALACETLCVTCRFLGLCFGYTYTISSIITSCYLYIYIISYILYIIYIKHILHTYTHTHILYVQWTKRRRNKQQKLLVYPCIALQFFFLFYQYYIIFQVCFFFFLSFLFQISLSEHRCIHYFNWTRTIHRPNHICVQFDIFFVYPLSFYMKIAKD